MKAVRPPGLELLDAGADGIEKVEPPVVSVPFAPNGVRAIWIPPAAARGRRSDV
jgi:hypothetical protein